MELEDNDVNGDIEYVGGEMNPATMVMMPMMTTMMTIPQAYKLGMTRTVAMMSQKTKGIPLWRT